MTSDWGGFFYFCMYLSWGLGIAGVIFFGKKNTPANGIAHISAMAGGGFGMATSLIVLSGGDPLSFRIWSVIPGFMLSFSVDALSAFFLLMISLVSFVVAIYSMGYLREYYGKKNIGLLGAGFNLFLISMAAVVTADNGFAFLLMWELMSLVSFFLVVTEHEKEEVRKAGFVYVVMTHIGTAFIIFTFLTLFYYTGSLDFSAFQESQDQYPSAIKNLLFIMALIGFGTKAGMVPLHIWLPRAHPAASSHVSALMSAVMIKTAVYGIIRTIYDFLGEGPAWWGGLLLGIGIVSAFSGILYGLFENDIKRFLAYSSAENMGIIFIGLGSSLLFASFDNQVFASLALLAALYHALNHSIFKGLLFMGAGAVLYATHTRNIEQLGGLIRLMPWTAGFFLIGAMAISALPPLNGFVSEWLTFQSLLHLSFQSGNHSLLGISGAGAAAMLALTGALVAAGFVKFFGTAFLAMPRSQKAAAAKEVPFVMRSAMGIMALGTLILGVWPGLVSGLTHHVRNKYFPGTEATMSAGFNFEPALTDTVKLPLLPVFVTFVMIIIGTLFILRLRVGRSKNQTSDTWGCGTVLQPSMEYTGASFSQPIGIIFKSLLFPSINVKVHNGKMRYSLHIRHWFESHMYRPVVEKTVWISQQIRKVQNGSLQSYLAYIFVTLIVLLLWKA